MLKKLLVTFNDLFYFTSDDGRDASFKVFEFRKLYTAARVTTKSVKQISKFLCSFHALEINYKVKGRRVPKVTSYGEGNEIFCQLPN